MALPSSCIARGVNKFFGTTADDCDKQFVLKTIFLKFSDCEMLKYQKLSYSSFATPPDIFDKCYCQEIMLSILKQLRKSKYFLCYNWLQFSYLLENGAGKHWKEVLPVGEDVRNWKNCVQGAPSLHVFNTEYRP